MTQSQLIRRSLCALLAMLVSVDVQAQDALFDWRVGDPNWQSPAKESDRLITDRPHVSEATATVGKDRIQLETGYTFFLDRNAGIETTRHSWPEPLLRWGLFADWFELRLGTNYLQETQSTLLRRSRLSGMDDMLVASKIALVKQRGLLPDFTIFPQLRIPTGDRDWTGDKTLPGVNFAYSWAVTPLIEIECNTVFNRKRADDGVKFTPSSYKPSMSSTIYRNAGLGLPSSCFINLGRTTPLLRQRTTFIPAFNTSLRLICNSTFTQPSV